MKKIRLSSFAQDQLNAARVGRETELIAKKLQYDEIIAGVEAQREQAASKFINAAKNGQMFSAAGNLVSMIFHNVKMLPLPPSMSASGIAERCFEAGISGEAAVVRHIEAAMIGKQRKVTRTYFEDTDGDEVISEVVITPGEMTHSISGYRNRKGEIDVIAVTPWGIVAIEVKNLAGQVYTRGADWFRDTYSEAGYLCDEGIPIRDRGGRGPARQLDEPTALLEEMLMKSGFTHYPIQRVVVLAHERGDVGNIDFGHNRVDLVTHVAQLNLVEFLEMRNRDGRCMDCLDRHEIARVSSLIQADHARFAQSMARR